MKDELERMKSRLNRKILKFDSNAEKEKAKIKEKECEAKENKTKENEALESKEFSDKKSIEEERKKERESYKLEEELKNTKEALEKEKKENEKLQKEKQKEAELEKEKIKQEKEKKEKEEFGPSGIGIYDRRSIIKQMRKKQANEDNATFEKAFNPPAEVLSVRYKKLLKELLYALFFTIVMGIFHILMFKEIKFPEIAAQGVIASLTLIGIYFFEKSYRKGLNVKIFIRGLEFIFVAVFLLYYTDKRIVSTKLVTLILPIISVCLIFYYIAKVIIIEKIERAKYIRSLSDVDLMINKDEKSEEIGMLYRKNVNNKKLTYLLKVMDEKAKKAPVKAEDKKNIKLKMDSPYKKEKRTKKEQKKFDKWKAKVKS